MNRIQTIAIGGSLIMAVVALIAFSQFRTAKNEAAVGSLTIWGTVDESIFKDAFSQYLQATDISILYSKKSEATLGSEFTEALARGTGPDLVITDAAWISNHADILSKVPATSFKPQDFRNTFVDVAGSSFIVADENDESISAFPLWVDPLVLYWNRDLLNAFSIATPPTNWTDMIAVSNTIKSIGQGGFVNRAGISMGRARNIPLFKEIISLLLLQQRAQIEDANGKFIFGSSSESPSESVLRFYTDFGNLSNNTVYTWNTNLSSPRSLFLEGKLALMLDYASYITSLNAQNPHLSVSIAEAPQLQGSEIPVHFANVVGIAVSHMSEKINPSWSFAYWLAGSEPASLFLRGRIVAPARRDLQNDAIYTQNPFYTVLQKAALNARWLKERSPKENSDSIFEMIESVADGKRTVSEAIIYAKGRRQQ